MWRPQSPSTPTGRPGREIDCGFSHLMRVDGAGGSSPARPLHGRSWCHAGVTSIVAAEAACNARFYTPWSSALEQRHRTNRGVLTRDPAMTSRVGLWLGMAGLRRRVGWKLRAPRGRGIASQVGIEHKQPGPHTPFVTSLMRVDPPPHPPASRRAPTAATQSWLESMWECWAQQRPGRPLPAGARREPTVHPQRHRADGDVPVCC